MNRIEHLSPGKKSVTDTVLKLKHSVFGVRVPVGVLFYFKTRFSAEKNFFTEIITLTELITRMFC